MNRVAIFVLLAVVCGFVAMAAESDDFVVAHNKFRDEVDPPASNMKDMTWDQALADMAQEVVEKCVWGHSQADENISQFENLGQDLYITGGSESVRPTAEVIVKTWYDEHEFYSYSNNACEEGKICGHYTQVVWADTYSLGCAMHFCNQVEGLEWIDLWIVACNYGPAGNMNTDVNKPYLSAAVDA